MVNINETNQSLSQTIARRLTVYELTLQTSLTADSIGIFIIDKKVRPYLTRMLGITGYSALLARAITLASVKHLWWAGAQVEMNGSIEGLAKIQIDVNPQDLANGWVDVLSELLGLLMSFVGEPLTVRLISDLWPNFLVDDLYLDTGHKQ